MDLVAYLSRNLVTQSGNQSEYGKKQSLETEVLGQENKCQQQRHKYNRKYTERDQKVIAYI